jgi:hypothetical protein
VHAKNNVAYQHPTDSFDEGDSIMVAMNPSRSEGREDDIARFTETAYRAVLNCGFRGSFLDLELSLWHAIRQAVEQQAVKFAPKEAA